MKRYRLSQLPDTQEGHFLRDIIPGEFLREGALSFKAPAQRTHTEGRHVHDDAEVFVILQGRAVMEVNGQPHALGVGDVVVIEPGEDHHLLSDAVDPCVNLWLHAGPERHPSQKGSR